ncbi:MAG: glycosyltransferase family 39 protein [Alphaproteobacteria bacterium]|nr:glycosyltransferase family 39 protein [Alphaproteobacteria bacterium]
MFAHDASQASIRWGHAALFLILAVTVIRIIGLGLAAPELYPDESQYWVWSRSFDWGYFSKPPMIAWVIALSTGLFGDSDFTVRLPAPLFHAGTASLLFLSAQRLWDTRTGFYTALVYLTLPSIWVASAAISTDTPMMLFWSMGLYALIRLREAPSWTFAALLGAAIGFGFMSKYAMIYFVIGTGLAILLDKPTRKALLGLQGALAGIIGLIIISPNLMWNAANDFATVSHTAANANWGGDLFQFDELADFLAGQMLVFGPATFIALVIVLYRTLRQREADTPHALFLAVYILPPLLTVSAQSFISRAHANWAAASYVAATLLVTFFLLQGTRFRRYVLFGSIGFHVALGLFTAALAASPALTEATGMSNSTKRIRAWEDTADAVTALAMERPYAAIVFDNRNIFHQMQRYADDLDRPLAMWLRYSGPVNHAEQGWPLAESFDGEILIISERPREVARMREDFEHFEAAGELVIPLDGDKTRDFTLWRASGHDRVERDEDYENRWTAIDRVRDDL